MMKKITILPLMCAVALSICAQEKLPDFPNPESQLVKQIMESGLNVSRPIRSDVMITEDDDLQGTPATIQHVVHRPVSARTATVADSAAGYLNPEGTLFCGMDEKGKGTWMQEGAVIGAWSKALPCWKWRNTTTGAFKKITYATTLSATYPEEADSALYSVDDQWNFYDSIVAAGGWNESLLMSANGDDKYMWQMAVPVQTVTRNDDKTEVFSLLNSAIKPNAKNYCPIAAGGLPSGNSADGLWPLTNAINISKQHGTSMELISSTDEDKYCHYLYGSSSFNLDTTITPDDTTYTRTAPVKMVTTYDKPQAMLYVKSITLAVGAEKYDAFHKDELKINGLHLEVQDMKGKVLAASDADRDDCSNMSYKAGQLLTFSFKETSDHGELMQEGFTVNEAFQIVITGFNEEDEFGIYAARCTSYAPKTSITYADGISRNVEYEPYIMLNGIYPTLETYADTAYIAEVGYDYGIHGDTIDINMEEVNSLHYKYRAYWAGKDARDGYEFDYYSTFVPYDSLTRNWLMDIERPEYIQIGCDYEWNLTGDPENVITLWDYERVFMMYIYATDTPVLGDIIKVGKCGKYAIFRIVAINGATALNEVTQQERNANVRKVAKNGRIFVMRDGKLYNMLGGMER